VWFEQRGYPAMVGKINADIAHVPYWATPLSSPAPVVTSVLDVIALMMPEYAGGFFGKFYTSLVTAATPGSSHLITISETAKADILKYLNVPPEKITVTYPGVDDVFHPRMGAENDEAIRQKYNLPDEFVLYLGGYDRRKNVKDLLLAYTYVKQAQGDQFPLVLAGREPAWGTSVFPDLPKYIQELDIEDVVHRIGYVDEADKPALYRLATVFVYPSLYEGFGLQIAESMASGTPVVARETDIFKEVVGDAGYLVENSRRMGGAILGLLLQPPFRQTMVNQGLAQATRYSWRKTARETLAVYENVLKQ
jgi:glycosyltransferase involved in cell wall biosynthesis